MLRDVLHVLRDVLLVLRDLEDQRTLLELIVDWLNGLIDSSDRFTVSKIGCEYYPIE